MFVILTLITLDSLTKWKENINNFKNRQCKLKKEGCGNQFRWKEFGFRKCETMRRLRKLSRNRCNRKKLKEANDQNVNQIDVIDDTKIVRAHVKLKFAFNNVVKRIPKI